MGSELERYGIQWRGLDMSVSACSHVWVDPTEPIVQRAPYSPVIGEKRREMKPGRIYECQHCGARCNTSPAVDGALAPRKGERDGER